MSLEHIKAAKAYINPDDRIVMAKKEITPLRFPVHQSEPSPKPKGLWYAIGTAWLDWIEVEMPHWAGTHFYKLEVDSSKLLNLTDEIKLAEFTQQYAEKGGNTRYSMNMNIDWKQVAKSYSGIEINPYQHGARMSYMWYYGWDVASGCIWSEGAITKIEKIKI